MESKKITQEIREKLRKPLPPEAISQHPTKTFLSTIKSIYVIERLNDVFGIGGWTFRSEIIDNSSAMIIVRVTLSVPEYGILLESFGGNNNGGENSKGFDLGDAYKGATTDALTKIGSYLEIGIDVFKGLKDKKQEAKKEETKTIPTEPVLEGQINHAKELLTEDLFSPEEIQRNLDGFKKLTRAQATEALLKLTHTANQRRSKKEKAAA